jgi:hypothetical protein
MTPRWMTATVEEHVASLDKAGKMRCQVVVSSVALLSRIFQRYVGARASYPITDR